MRDKILLSGYFAEGQNADPVIQESLFEIPGTDNFVLSAAALFHSAAAYFNKYETDDGKTRLVEHFPALSLKRIEKGPDGEQKYAIRRNNVSLNAI